MNIEMMSYVDLFKDKTICVSFGFTKILSSRENNRPKILTAFSGNSIIGMKNSAGKDYVLFNIDFNLCGVTNDINVLVQ